VSTLTERLRAIVKPGARRPPLAGDAREVSTLEDALGGSWERDGRSFVVERRSPSDEQHGGVSVLDIADALEQEAGHASLLGKRTPASAPFLFLDLETTGLSGGAGTYAFLVGCGWFEGGAFVTRQHLMFTFDAEKPMLEAVGSELRRAGTLVTFNGKSFDAPVLETRYLFHRLEWPAMHLPHIDLLHPARRFWGELTCSLTALEERVLGATRTGDVPGFEIPGRYFQFLRSGDARPLSSVLEHNRRDLLSLAGLTSDLLRLLSDGPLRARDAREALALGHLYGRSGKSARAKDAFESAIRRCKAPEHAATKIDALRALASALRRERQFEAAAICWRQLSELSGCPAHVAREAKQALAIHHEHRLRDLATAKTFALQSLDGDNNRAWNDAVRHRLARLERKMDGAASGRLQFPSLPSRPSCGSPRSAPQTSS
jgi:uncharacterized protein YprB with RNaseH-like and TPR domain